MKRRKQITQIEVDSRCLLGLRVSCIRQRLFHENSRLLTCAKVAPKTSREAWTLRLNTKNQSLRKKYFDNRSVGWRFSRQIFWKIIERGSVEWHNKVQWHSLENFNTSFERRKSSQWNAPLKRKIIFHLLHPHISLVYLLKLKPQSGPLNKKRRNKMIFYES